MTDPQQLVDAALAPSSPPMGDETPLAFAAAPATTMEAAPPIPTPTPVPPPVAPATTTTPPVPPLPEPAYVPPVQDEPKPKVGAKILFTIFGIFALLGVLGVGGFYAYQQFAPKQPAQIAVVGRDRDSCNGCLNGGWLVWRDGQCKVTGICDSGVDGKDTDNPNPSPTTELPPSACSGGTCTCGSGYAYCGGQINKCVADATLAEHGGCNGYGRDVYNIPITYGANYSSTTDLTKCPIKGCSCGGHLFCFDKTGYCDQKDANTLGLQGQDYNKYGLCAVAGSYSSMDPNAPFTPKDPIAGQYSCTDDQCTATDTDCWTVRYTCSSTVGGNSCTETSSSFIKKTSPAKSTGFEGKCGTVEQLDVQCGGVYQTSRTKINPACTSSATPTPSPGAPVLACTGLTKNVTDAAIKLNTAITFTCAGAVTPATAGTVSYQFRYMIGTGAWQNLAALAGGKTASLTPTQCGVQYKVQCRACATLNGVKQCDPVWQGVAP